MLPAKISLKLDQSFNRYAFSSTSTFRPKQNDFYIYFNDQIIPVVRSRMTDCKLMDEECNSGSKRVICIT